MLVEKLDLQDDALFADMNQWDSARWPEQIALLEALFSAESRQHWCYLLEVSDACFAPVLTYGEVQDHPHNRARAAYVEVDGDWHPRPAPRFSVSEPQPAWDEVPALTRPEIIERIQSSR